MSEPPTPYLPSVSYAPRSGDAAVNQADQPFIGHHSGGATIFMSDGVPPSSDDDDGGGEPSPGHCVRPTMSPSRSGSRLHGAHHPLKPMCRTTLELTTRRMRRQLQVSRRIGMRGAAMCATATGARRAPRPSPARCFTRVSDRRAQTASKVEFGWPMSACSSSLNGGRTFPTSYPAGSVLASRDSECGSLGGYTAGGIRVGV